MNTNTKKGILTVLVVALFFLSDLPGTILGAQQRGRQPGATQGGPTSGNEVMPPFDMRYFLGEWEVEWSPPETPLFPGGRYAGTETVTHINQGRFYSIDIQLEGPEGPLTGKGLMVFDSGPYGQYLTRYVVFDNGLTLLKPGPIAGDLGGYYSQFWETPAIERNDAKIVIKGRSYLVSPAAYRVNQQISVDDGDFTNFGVVWLTKEMEAPGSPARQ